MPVEIRTLASALATAVKAQHAPHSPWLRTGGRTDAPSGFRVLPQFSAVSKEEMGEEEEEEEEEDEEDKEDKEGRGGSVAVSERSSAPRTRCPWPLPAPTPPIAVAVSER
jgi:hypothetical protein